MPRSVKVFTNQSCSHRLLGSYIKLGHIGVVFPLRVMKMQYFCPQLIAKSIEDSIITR